MTAASPVRYRAWLRRLCPLRIPRETLLLALGYGCFRSGSALVYAGSTSDQSTTNLFIASVDFTVLTALLVAVGALVVCAAAHVNPIRKKFQQRGIWLIPTAIAASATMALLPFGPLANGPSGGPLCSGLYALSSIALSLMWLCALIRQGAAPCLGALVGAMGVLAATNLVALTLGPATRAASAAALLATSTLLLIRDQTHRASQTARPPIPALHGPLPSTPFASQLRSELSALAVPLVTTGALEGIFGFLNGFLVGADLYVTNQIAFVGGAAAGAVYGLARRPSIPEHAALRRWFPWIASVVAIAPFAGASIAGALGAAFAFLYVSLGIQAMKCVLFAGCERPEHALEILGIAMSVRYLGRGLGVSVGVLLGQLAVGQAAVAQGLLAASLISLYALGLALWKTEHARPSLPAAPSPAPGTAPKTTDVDNPIERRVADLALLHRLTLREQQVCALLARGRSATFIANELSCTAGTVRSHAKNLYAKLGVHTKQELIDLFERDALPSSRRPMH